MIDSDEVVLLLMVMRRYGGHMARRISLTSPIWPMWLLRVGRSGFPPWLQSRPWPWPAGRLASWPWPWPCRQDRMLLLLRLTLDDVKVDELRAVLLPGIGAEWGTQQ